MPLCFCIMQPPIWLKGTTNPYLAKNQRLSGSRLLVPVGLPDSGLVSSSTIFAAIADKPDKHLQFHHESVSLKWRLMNVRLRLCRHLRL